jgi:hypothetical protein
LKELLAKAETVAERIEIYGAMGATPNAQDKLEILEWTTSGQVLLQDFMCKCVCVRCSIRSWFITCMVFLLGPGWQTYIEYMACVQVSVFPFFPICLIELVCTLCLFVPYIHLLNTGIGML